MRPSIRELVVAIAFGSIVYRAQGQITQRQRPGVGHRQLLYTWKNSVHPQLNFPTQCRQERLTK
jgi:hypothetical protein